MENFSASKLAKFIIPKSRRASLESFGLTLSKPQTRISRRGLTPINSSNLKRESLNFVKRIFPLIIKPLKLAGTFEITLNRIGDSRGYFMETFSHKVFADNGIEADWVQENQSFSARQGIIRGLHFQVPPMSQAKFVRVIQGEILDVFVDLRKTSETFGKWDSIHLSAENCQAVYIPQGFAHGFSTLSENVIVQYKVDNPYSRKHEQGILWNDPGIGIDWEVTEPFLSEKDEKLPTLKDLVSPF